jgi:two-component system, OmpR family, response regulator
MTIAESLPRQHSPFAQGFRPHRIHWGRPPEPEGHLPDHFARLLNQLGQDGLTIIEALPHERMHTHLALSALGEGDDRVRGLRAGGDDDPTKPSATVDLIARIEALLRQPAESRETVLRVGPLELDLIERTAKRGKRTIDLRPREFRLLEYMMHRKEQTLTRAILLKEVWNYKFVPQSNLVDVHMGRLRRKVDPPHEPRMIYNVRGVGFILRAPA